MDTDQQVRERFLEESGEYCEQIEQALLGLPDAENPAQRIDIAMRAAHSLKGGAGMMGFTPMAQVAHRLEDYLKIVRARSINVDTSLETLFLQGVDSLKEVREGLSLGQELNHAWMALHVDTVIQPLQERLGDLSEADEDRLLSEEENIDIAILVFNGGVEEALGTFEAELERYEGESLRQALLEQASCLQELGLMGGIDAFVTLCQSIHDQVQTLRVSQLPAFTDQALSVWRRSQSLVQLGRMAKLPQQFNFVADPELDNLAAIPSAPDLTKVWELAPAESAAALEELDFHLDAAALESLQTEVAHATARALDPLDDATYELPDAVDAEEGFSQPFTEDAAEIPEIANHETLIGPDLTSEFNEADPTETAELINAPELDLADLSQLQSALDQIELSTFENTEIAAASESKESPLPPSDLDAAVDQPLAPAAQPPEQIGTAHRRTGTIRVAAEDLQQLNDLFGTLILERNALNLRQRQLDEFAALLQDRMQDLEAFNVRLRQWYDRSSMESLLPNGTMPVPVPVEVAASKVANTFPINTSSQNFDTLEMDQYSELHLLAREQMETVVKLQEVTADIRLGLQDMGQVTQSLNGTTRQLQNRITRTQMRPFSDVVGRFPRLIRDLSVQYGKKVKLKLEGENTLFERAALDVLVDPLTHILRNSFDHGIEPEVDRVAAGKAPEGTILLRASQLGNRARIVIRDDGRGINLDKIRDRIRKQNIGEAIIAKMSEQDLLSLIFDAGFSTADQVTELSGRGVGMDVVRTNLNHLGGNIQVDTKPGQGTTFTIDIPLSLSVLRIMLFEQQELVFAVPVDAVEELTAFNPQQVQDSEEGPQIQWQNQLIPLVSLENHLVFNSKNPFTPLAGKPMIDHPMVLVVRHRAGYYAVAIQRFWGEQEVATRPITSPLPLPAGFVGATVLGDGRVVPMVDLPQLIASFVLPQDRFTAQPQSLSPIPTAATQSSQNTILVVDDSVHLRRYLTLSLEKAGYYVEQARDGQEAVDKLLGGLQVQAVLCDVEMPRLDGYGVLDEIKSRPEFETLPISMLTSRSSEKHRKLALNLGASAYFAKPYNEQELLTTLQKLIEATQEKALNLPTPIAVG